MISRNVCNYAKFTGVGVKFVEFPYPESAFDIDTIGQLELAHDISHSTLEARLG